jgi:cell division septum initiation protein DivIVA
MDNETSQRRARDVGKRIASLIQSIGQGPEKQISRDERQKLKHAAARLDQMLKAAADAERQVLRDAAGRLDRLLVDIRKGKDLNSIKRRRDRQEPTQ